MELTLPKELMLIIQPNQKSAIKEFNFQLNVCNGCLDLVMMSMNVSDIAVLNIKSVGYRCIITGISKIGSINLMQNINLTEKSRTFKDLSSHIKWVKKF